MATFNIVIVTPHEVIYKGEADFIKLRTVAGDMGILANHAPLVSEIALGEMIIRAEDKSEECFYISGGFLEISRDKTLVLADDAINIKEIDIVKAKREAEVLRAQKDKIQEERDLVQVEKALQESLMKVQLAQR